MGVVGEELGAWLAAGMVAGRNLLADLLPDVFTGVGVDALGVFATGVFEAPTERSTLVLSVE